MPSSHNEKKPRLADFFPDRRKQSRHSQQSHSHSEKQRSYHDSRQSSSSSQLYSVKSSSSLTAITTHPELSDPSQFTPSTPTFSHTSMIESSRKNEGASFSRSSSHYRESRGDSQTDLPLPSLNGSNNIYTDSQLMRPVRSSVFSDTDLFAHKGATVNGSSQPHSLTGDSKLTMVPPSNAQVKGKKTVKHGNFQTIYDPELSRSKSGGLVPKYRYSGEGASDPKDPRYYKGIRYSRSKRGKKECLSSCTVPKFVDDENSIIPPGETYLLVSKLANLTKKSTIMNKLWEYGKVSDIEMVHDPTSGEFLGVCRFKFDGERNPSHNIAKKFIRESKSLLIDNQNPRVDFDEDGTGRDRIVTEILKIKNDHLKIMHKEAPPAQQKHTVLNNIDLRTSDQSSNGSIHSQRLSKLGSSRLLGNSKHHVTARRRTMELRSGRLPADFQVVNPAIFISGHYVPTNIKIRSLVDWFNRRTAAVYVCDRYFIAAFHTTETAQRCFDEKCRVSFNGNHVALRLFLNGLTEIDAEEAQEEEDRKQNPSRASRPGKALEDAESSFPKEVPAKRRYSTVLSNRITNSYPNEIHETGKASNAKSENLNEFRQPPIARSIIAPKVHKYPPVSSSATAEVSVEERAPISNPFSAFPTSLLSFRSFKRKLSNSTPSKLQLSMEPAKHKVSARPMNHGLNDDSSEEEDDELESLSQTPMQEPSSETSISTSISEKTEPSSIYPNPLPQLATAISASSPEKPQAPPLLAAAPTLKKTKPAKRRARASLDYTSSEEESEDHESYQKKTRKKSKLAHSDDNHEATASMFLDETPQTPPHQVFENDDKSMSSQKRQQQHTSQITPDESPSDKRKLQGTNTQNSLQKVLLSKNETVFNKSRVPLVSPEEEPIDQSIKGFADDGEEDTSAIAETPPPEGAVVSLEKHPISDSILNPRLSWEPTKGGMEPVCSDDFETLLDLDGIQSFVKDDEDLAFLKEALASVESEELGNINLWTWNHKEIKAVNYGREAVGTPIVIENGLEETQRWSSNTGASRSDGYKRIPDKDKAAYLPHRRKIHKPIDTIQEEAGTGPASSAVAPAGLSNSRHNRASNRRLANDINHQKQMLSSETDILKFNQLKKRKKPVKFARSAIHNWGLYAVEPIGANDMIIEYVGEVVRQKVAELREKKYLRSGIGSSYLFRIDEQTVIDATKLGGIARFINHSCTPSCTAKIIKVEGKKRIVIYAVRDIQANEELTYDYKFEREVNDDERIPCLCGSSGCKGYLN